MATTCQRRQRQPYQNTSQFVDQPPTLHLKPETRFNTLAYDSDSDSESPPLRHYRMTMQDNGDDEPPDEAQPIIPELEPAPPPLTVTEILADVDRQLAHHPANTSTEFPTTTH
jgi:hypothetical protein